MMKSILVGMALALLAQPLFADGLSLELSTSGYQYTEPTLMSLAGQKTGVKIRYSMTFTNEVEFSMGIRGATGQTDYSSNGTGTSAGNGDYYFEPVVILSVSLPSAHKLITGFGFRRLESDLRGYSSTGHSGYRRQSSYRYVLIGAFTPISIFGIQGKAAFEYDKLISGTQVSKLSDIDQTLDDLVNQQSSGFGIKVEALFEMDGMKIGPYVHYWDIARSNVAPVVQSGSPVAYGVEPANQTIEVGFAFKKSFE